MRTYSSFLLFEEVLDFAPTSDTRLYQFIQDVTRPKARIISDDCGTTVGTQVTVNYEIEGLVELATDTVINKVRIDALLSSGIYSTAVRDLYSCVAIGGICQKCYEGTYIDMGAPDVGTVVRLQPEYNFQSDVFICNGMQTTFNLTQAPSTYTKVLVIIDGAIQWTGFTITDTTLEMDVAPSLGKHIVVKYFKITAQPFVGWLSQTYSGSLLGMQPLPTQNIHIRPSLAQSLFTDEELNIMAVQLQNYKLIPSDTLGYVDNIHDKLEKAIFIAMLYGIYSNGN